MIQRKQSLYLLLITALMVLMSFLPVIDLYIDYIGYSFHIFGGFSPLGETVAGTRQIMRGGISSAVMLSGVAFLSFANIFFFRRRRIQIKICYLILIAIVIFVVSVFYDSCFIYKHSITDFHMRIASVFPLFAIIFDLMALSGIKKDENLVRSADRIR